MKVSPVPPPVVSALNLEDMQEGGVNQAHNQVSPTNAPVDSKVGGGGRAGRGGGGGGSLRELGRATHQFLAEASRLTSRATTGLPGSGGHRKRGVAEEDEVKLESVQVKAAPTPIAHSPEVTPLPPLFASLPRNNAPLPPQELSMASLEHDRHILHEIRQAQNLLSYPALCARTIKLPPPQPGLISPNVHMEAMPGLQPSPAYRSDDKRPDIAVMLCHVHTYTFTQLGLLWLAVYIALSPPPLTGPAMDALGQAYVYWNQPCNTWGHMYAVQMFALLLIVSFSGGRLDVWRRVIDRRLGQCFRCLERPFARIQQAHRRCPLCCFCLGVVDLVLRLSVTWLNVIIVAIYCFFFLFVPLMLIMYAILYPLISMILPWVLVRHLKTLQCCGPGLGYDGFTCTMSIWACMYGALLILSMALIHLVSVPNNSNIYNNFFLRLPCCAQRRARLGQKWCCVHFSLIMCFVLFALCTAVLAAPSTTLSEYYPEPCGFYCGIQGSPEYYYGSVPVV